MEAYRAENPENWDKQLKRYHADPEYREKKKQGMREYQKANRSKLREYRNQAGVKEKQRLHAMNGNLKANYGITLEVYEQIYEAQGGGCAICGVSMTLLAAGPAERLCVDHCHSTGQIRGLLCKPCNTALGALSDDTLRLQKAIRYLNGSNADLVASVLLPADAEPEHGGVPDAGSDANFGLDGERA